LDFAFATGVRIGLGLIAATVIGSSIHLADLSAQSPGQVPVPIPGRNVNMASGITLPGGDPWIAVDIPRSMKGPGA
jgi:hypothetical protein